MMSATAAGDRTGPNDPGPNSENIHSCPNSASNCGQQDPMPSQDTGPSPHLQQHFSTRPFFYVPAPPPPPFLPFQWPMPFSYNPFGGFPGYGMVIPPFAPPPYVDSPAYILPNPHIQPVDYRRFLHPQVPVPTAPYQNPNHTRRIRLPHTAPVRETVNSAVQTEPTRSHVGHYVDGSPPIRSDSGHGTTSDSPSSSGSSSQKQASVHDCSLTSSHAKDLQSLKTCSNGTDEHGEILTPHPVDIDVPSCIRTTVERQKSSTASVDQENVPTYKNSHCNMWSVGSPDGIVPVCSSSQQEDDIKERRVSFPDILMSWGGGTPQAPIQEIHDKDFDQNENQLPFYKNVEEQEKSVCGSPTATDSSVLLENTDVDDDSANILCSREFPMESRRNGRLELCDSGKQSCPSKDLLYSLNVSNEQEKDEMNLSEEPTDMISYQTLLSSCRKKGKLNESVWSVESLPPFVPPKELIRQKKNVEIIIEMSEESANKEATKSSGSVPVSSGLISPSQKTVCLSKKPEMETEPTGTRAKQKPDQVSPEGKALGSPTLSPCDVTPTAKDVEENRPAQPEATQSPNQEVTIKNTGQGHPKHTLPVSVEVEVIHQKGANVETLACGEETCCLMSRQRTDCVSPSKGQLVDCGIQCTSLLPYPQDEPRRYNLKYSDMKRDNGGKAEGFYTNGQMQKNYKRNGLRKYRGNGRNHWQ